MDRDQAQRFVGPDLDPYVLKRSLKSNVFIEIVGKYFHFVRELLEGIVHPASHQGPNCLSMLLSSGTDREPFHGSDVF